MPQHRDPGSFLAMISAMRTRFTACAKPCLLSLPSLVRRVPVPPVQPDGIRAVLLLALHLLAALIASYSQQA